MEQRAPSCKEHESFGCSKHVHCQLFLLASLLVSGKTWFFVNLPAHLIFFTDSREEGEEELHYPLAPLLRQMCVCEGLENL